MLKISPGAGFLCKISLSRSSSVYTDQGLSRCEELWAGCDLVSGSPTDLAWQLPGPSPPTPSGTTRDFMPLLPVIKTDSADSYVDFHFGCISWKASKHNRQHCIQKCNMISGNTQRLQGWGTLGSGNAQLWHSKQAASVQWILKQPAASFGPSSYSLTFWEDISSQASHC